MHLTSRSANVLTSHRRQALTGPHANSRRDPAVVRAYAKLRDRLSREVDKQADPHKLLRLTLATDFVLACLKMRPLGLGKAEIKRQAARCDAVRAQVAKLGS